MEAKLEADCLALVGPIQSGVEKKVREAIEAIDNRRKKLAIILHTGGGLVEITERMVNIIRHHYEEVVFIVPNVAMSAGTIFVNVRRSDHDGLLLLFGSDRPAG